MYNNLRELIEHHASLDERRECFDCRKNLTKLRQFRMYDLRQEFDVVICTNCYMKWQVLNEKEFKFD